MKKYLILIGLVAFFSVNALAQDIFFTKNGSVDFTSKASVENIEGKNTQVVSFLKTETGDLNFGVLVKAFKFENALMEEHFNENYLESDKFPKAKFKSKITNLDEIDFDKSGTYTAKLTGKLTIHGVTKEISTTAQLKVKNKKITASSDIIIKLEDYDIDIPSIVKDKIAKEISIKIDMNYELYKK